MRDKKQRKKERNDTSFQYAHINQETFAQRDQPQGHTCRRPLLAGKRTVFSLQAHTDQSLYVYADSVIHALSSISAAASRNVKSDNKKKTPEGPWLVESKRKQRHWPCVAMQTLGSWHSFAENIAVTRRILLAEEDLPSPARLCKTMRN